MIEDNDVNTSVDNTSVDNTSVDDTSVNEPQQGRMYNNRDTNHNNY